LGGIDFPQPLSECKNIPSLILRQVSSQKLLEKTMMSPRSLLKGKEQSMFFWSPKLEIESDTVPSRNVTRRRIPLAEASLAYRTNLWNGVAPENYSPAAIRLIRKDDQTWAVMTLIVILAKELNLKPMWRSGETFKGGQTR